MNKQKWIERLLATKSEGEWNFVCNAIKVWTKPLPETEKSGDYPVWWFHTIIIGGVMAAARQGWS